MKQEQIIAAFAQLGKLMCALGNNEEWSGFGTGVTAEEYIQLQTVINRQESYNGWFTKENVRKSLLALGGQLTQENLSSFASNYNFAENPKRIAIIMAGNIPLVGFHDFLCVVMSGNKAVCKLSSDDKTLLPALANHLIQFEPELKECVGFSTGKLGEVDAVIATGSNNSLIYFEQYFGKYPHIFRRNRTSIAILDGSETKDELEALGADIFQYFGLGCRNVSHLVVPEGYDWSDFFEAIVSHGNIINHHKYCNNYDYNKTVYLMNQHKLLDNNFMLLFESDVLHSPLSMVHYHTYKTEQEVEDYLSTHAEELQVVIAKGRMPFGEAQCPTLSDYADGVDTMAWLNKL